MNINSQLETSLLVLNINKVKLGMVGEAKSWPQLLSSLNFTVLTFRHPDY